MLRKLLLIVGAVLLVVVAGGAVFVASRQHLRFDTTPYPSVTASADSAVVERGRYIVRVAAPCAACHGDPTQRKAYAEGADVPLTGGFVFDIPPGKFYTRNLTPDAETGLGRVPDSAIARPARGSPPPAVHGNAGAVRLRPPGRRLLPAHPAARAQPGPVELLQLVRQG